MQEPPGKLRGVAAATVLGWILFDVALIANSPEPLLIRKLLWPAAVAISLATAAGWLWDRYPVSLRLMLGVTGGLCVASLALADEAPRTWIWLPHVVLLLTVSSAIAARMAARMRVSGLATGCALGMIAAAATAAYFGNLPRRPWVLIAFALVGTVSSRLPRTTLRRTAGLTALLVPAVLLVVIARERSQLRRPDHPRTSVAAEAGRPHLLMIVLDTVSANHLAPYDYHRVTTPGLDAFVGRCATLYSAAYAASSWTLPAHASLFTGLYPSQHGAHYCRTKALCGAGVRQALRGDEPTLAERLAAVGYQTAAISANAGNLDHRLGLDRGFAHYDDRWGLSLRSPLLPQFAGVLPHVGHSYYRSGDVITDLALDWMAHAQAGPFFLFLNYMDAHGPYLPAPPHDRAFGPERPLNPYQQPRGLSALQYDRTLRALDEHVTRLLREIEERGLLDETVVIITSDHGEAFGEHGWWGHTTNLYGELTNVPLYVKPVGACRHQRSSSPMTAIDVHDLALRAVGLEPEPRTAPQMQVVAEMHGSKRHDVEPTDGLVAWLDGDTKWIVSATGAVEMFDLRVDPTEQHNLAADRDEIERARARARDWWTAHPPQATVRRETEALDAETLDRMRVLGY